MIALLYVIGAPFGAYIGYLAPLSAPSWYKRCAVVALSAALWPLPVALVASGTAILMLEAHRRALPPVD